jgi:PAS domain S-box-containing protein
MINAMNKPDREYEKDVFYNRLKNNELQETSPSDSLILGILEAAPDAIVIVNGEGRILLVNTQTEKIFGYKRDELLFQPVEILLPDQFREGHVKHREHYVADPRMRPMGQGLNLAGRRKDGSEFPVEISLSPMKTKDGLFVISIIRDVTDRKQAEGELVKINQHLGAILSSTKEAIFTISMDAKIQTCNQAALEILGYRESEVIGQSTEKFYPSEESFIEFGKRLNPALKEDGYFSGEFELRRANGEIFPAEFMVNILKRSGEELGVVAVVRDITERKKVEEMLRRSHQELERRVEERTAELSKAYANLKEQFAERLQAESLLRESEERFKAFMNNSAAVAWMKDDQGRYAYINEPYERRFKTSLADWCGKTDFEFFPAEVAKQLQQNDRTVLATGKVMELIEQVPTPDGLIHHWLVYKFPFKDKSGQRLVGGMAFDITEQVRAKEALREERDRAQNYLDVAGVIFVVIDSDQRITLINKKGCELLEYEEEEILGKNWFDTFIPERMRDQVKAAFVKLMSGEIKPVEYYENPVLAKNGQERMIAWHNAVLRDERGQIYATLSSGEDITEKRLLEQQVRQAEKLSAVGQLTTGLAHEIGTPLNVILGRAEFMLRKMSAEDPLRHNLESIIAQIERITKIVQQLLSFSRPKPPQVEPVHLIPLLQGVLSFLEYHIQQQGISATLDCAQNLPEVLVDRDQVQQVFFNIILNAIQSMPQGGKLTIRVSQTIAREQREDPVRDQYLKIEVADTGTGIPSDKLSKIFDPFFSTKEVGKGSGLGLTVCYELVKSHEGWIDVKSQVGEGSIFTVYLPLRSLQTKGLNMEEKVHG